MKFLEKYDMYEWEVGSPYTFEDKNLIVHQITHGENMGKIFFRFRNKDTKEFTDKYMMVLGCVKILDTEYEKNPIIRNIELGPIKFRKVQVNTLGATLNTFLKEIGYDNMEIDNVKKRSLYTVIPKFHDKVRELTMAAKNLGDVLDGLREIRKYIFDIQREHYEKWELDRMTKKYNI